MLIVSNIDNKITKTVQYCLIEHLLHSYIHLDGGYANVLKRSNTAFSITENACIEINTFIKILDMLLLMH